MAAVVRREAWARSAPVDADDLGGSRTGGKW